VAVGKLCGQWASCVAIGCWGVWAQLGIRPGVGAGVRVAHRSPGPNLNQRVTVIDSSQRETLCARNYAGEGQAA
jgi:hypothetical protein